MTSPTITEEDMALLIEAGTLYATELHPGDPKRIIALQMLLRVATACGRGCPVVVMPATTPLGRGTLMDLDAALAEARAKGAKRG